MLACQGQGSITSLVSETGGGGGRGLFVAERYTYDSFGQLTVTDPAGTPRAVSAFGNPYAFTGREFDPESGLYYYRERYYDPKLGRFLQEDPVGFSAGPNLYSYARNMPLTQIDPYGLLDQGPIKNKAIEFLIGQKLKKSLPGVPDQLRGKVAETLRKEMKDSELKFLNRPEATRAEKEQITEGLIKRAIQDPENQDLRNQVNPYLPAELKKSSGENGEACIVNHGG